MITPERLRQDTLREYRKMQRRKARRDRAKMTVTKADPEMDAETKAMLREIVKMQKEEMRRNRNEYAKLGAKQWRRTIGTAGSAGLFSIAAFLIAGISGGLLALFKGGLKAEKY